MSFGSETSQHSAAQSVDRIRQTTWQRPYSPLDGYRAIAILVVCFHHLYYGPAYPAALIPLAPFIRGGVGAFMVLSGFLVTQSLLKELNRTASLNLSAFFARQGIRFYIPTLSFLAVAAAVWGRTSLFDWSSSLRFLWLSPDTGSASVLTNHLYSLVGQVYFCLLCPVIFRLLPANWRFLTVSTGVIAVMIARTVTQDAAIRSGDLYPKVEYVFGPLLMGVWWAVAATEGRLDWLSKLDRKILVLTGSLAVAAWLIARSPTGFLAFLSSSWTDTIDEWRANRMISIPARFLMAATIHMIFGWVVFLLHSGSSNGPTRLLAWPGIAWLGRISFSVYLWQNVFCFGRTGSPLLDSSFLLSLLASIATGSVAYLFFERPSLNWRSSVKAQFDMGPTEAAGAMGSAQIGDER